MKKDNLQIKPYENNFREELLKVWEASVLATHHFLAPSDFKEIKALVRTIDFNHFEVYCMISDQRVAGFVGVADKKVEMLFMHPDHFGKGWGKTLLDFAANELHADKVDVNEQNTNAVNFYRKYGFEVFERTEKDDQGRYYPLLRMKLQHRSGTD